VHYREVLVKEKIKTFRINESVLEAFRIILCMHATRRASKLLVQYTQTTRYRYRRTEEEEHKFRHSTLFMTSRHHDRQQYNNDTTTTDNVRDSMTTYQPWRQCHKTHCSRHSLGLIVLALYCYPIPGRPCRVLGRRLPVRGMSVSQTEARAGNSLAKLGCSVATRTTLIRGSWRWSTICGTSRMGRGNRLRLKVPILVHGCVLPQPWHRTIESCCCSVAGTRKPRAPVASF